MISLILIIIAAGFNACMDKLAHHWNKSIFSNSKGYFFSDATIESWKNKYVNRVPSNGFIYWRIGPIKMLKPVFLSDGWHLFKSLMIFSLILSVVTYQFIGLTTFWYIDFVIFGTIWNLTFNLFYNKLLVK